MWRVSILDAEIHLERTYGEDGHCRLRQRQKEGRPYKWFRCCDVLTFLAIFRVWCFLSSFSRGLG